MPRVGKIISLNQGLHEVKGVGNKPGDNSCHSTRQHGIEQFNIGGVWIQDPIEAVIGCEVSSEQDNFSA